MSQDNLNPEQAARKQALLDALEPMIDTMLAESAQDPLENERLVREIIRRIGAALRDQA